MTTDASYSLDQMLSGVLHNALNSGRCRSCGRRTDDMIIGHDGFCPVPALTRAIARSAADRADLAQAQAERDAATRRAEQAEAVLSEQADIITANLWHIPPEYAARNILLDVAMKMRATLAGQEGGPR